jgi:non-canonical (house-cleaning) NTP pyrophosphatase
MHNRYSFVLGTTNEHKIGALRKVIKDLGITAEVTGCKVSSGQNEQPVGYDEGRLGALTRARNAFATGHHEVNNTFFVGIESFIVSDGKTSCLDMASIVICNFDGQVVSESTSPGVQFPMDAYLTARDKGFNTTTVGSQVAKLYGGDGTDPHSTLTQGGLTRTETLVSGLIVAVKQLSFD